MIKMVKEVGKMCVLGHAGLVVPGRGGIVRCVESNIKQSAYQTKRADMSMRGM